MGFKVGVALEWIILTTKEAHFRLHNPFVCDLGFQLLPLVWKDAECVGAVQV